MSITFKIGDIVQLRDGGELMTIEAILVSNSVQYLPD
ncbi:DUF2158 domain-containing protein [Undibacterium sp. 10I3]